MDDKLKIFTTNDPLGRKISLKGDTWGQHIIERHNMDASIEEIKTNIEHPNYILQNIKRKKDGLDEFIVDEIRQDYVGLVAKEGRVYIIKTIVEFLSEYEGTVVTNHILWRANEIKTIGGVIYDRNKSESTTKFPTL